jgi:hypothetical protein
MIFSFYEFICIIFVFHWSTPSKFSFCLFFTLRRVCSVDKLIRKLQYKVLLVSDTVHVFTCFIKLESNAICSGNWNSLREVRFEVFPAVKI